MEILQIKNLTFRYPETEAKAVDNVSFSVSAGEFVCLCGQSGCGKSTLLKLIKKELSPYGDMDGEIQYNGVPLSEIDDRTAASEIGFVLQKPESQIVTDKVWHELAFGLENLGFDTEIIRRRVAEMASYFGIEDWFHKKTAELSGGQKQLLNLASVMAMNPKVLLLDEPTAQLDPIAASGFIAALQKLNRELGLTVILAEHRLEDVFPIADRVLLMQKGQLLYADTVKGINRYFKDIPSHPMIAGMPSAMRIHSLLDEDCDTPITVREGRNYITENYGNSIDSIEHPKYEHSSEKAIELNDVWFRYGKELPDVLKGVDLAVYKGEHFCILGGNGTGKTTMLNVIAGLLKAYRGKIEIGGKKLATYNSNSLYMQNVARLPQDPQTLFLEKTVKADLYETCNLMQYTAEETEQRVKDLTEKLGITHLMNAHPFDLSGGEQQKAALAKILLSEPKLLLLDEPTKGIDAYSKQTLSEILTALKAEGMTIVTVTHDVSFAAAVADRCGLFFDGGLVSTAVPFDFFSENSFYTTAANRISRGYYKNAIRCEEVAELCRKNGKKAGTIDA